MTRARHLLLFLFLAMTARAACAEAVATITALVGNVAIQSAGGAQRVAAVGGDIDNGDTVETGVGSEIVMIFTDKQRVYLKPGSVFRVDDFHYAANAPQEDRSFLSLVKGGLRALDGLVAKEGKPENYRVKTPTSTIGIRGTEYSVTDCANLEPGANADCKGDQIVVYDGQIVVINQVDRQIVRAGEGAIVVSPRLPFGVLPASRVTPVVPSAACR
ncbi:MULTISPECIES: FecR family protein [Caballeronia]|uniref:FecR family protein n=1 Tax=Caballeronia TaxID=1827195 RepID=UPI00158F4FC1|nr:MULTISPECIES: FecR family protein [Caballeronia]MCG7405418.1 FecR domain-containing protein [Caballeronia zhejiangensis]MCI1047520.1 FecR domain-containing protein [Caballeronia zhejiangensis]